MKQELKDQIIALRQERGERYAKAAEEYVVAWISLRAIDLAICNRNVGLAYEPPTFATPPVLSVHGEFLPAAPALYARAHERAVEAHEWTIVELIAAHAATKH